MTAATGFEEVIDLDADGLAALGAHLPLFRFLLDDISSASDEALRGRAMSALGRLVLWCLKNARAPEQLVRELRGWAAIMREVRAAPNGPAAMAMVWRYIFTVNERYRPDELLPVLEEALGESEKEEVVNVADQLREEGRREGRRDILLKQLRTRFGALPEAVVARVKGAEPGQLDLWLERVLGAPTLLDVLGEP